MPTGPGGGHTDDGIQPFDPSPAAPDSKTRQFLTYGVDADGNAVPLKTLRITNNTADTVYPIMRDPNSMVGSDGEVIHFGVAAPHPRGYGTFVRVLGRYVRELKVITLQDAVRKMTSFPAQRLGLFDRGLVRPGMVADLVLFDENEIADQATFENPHQYAVGVKCVLVGGEVIFDGKSMTAARPGRILKGPSAEW